MADDQFERLLGAMPTIAEAVNMFSSEEVQREAFSALVRAFGLPDEFSATGDEHPPADSASAVEMATMTVAGDTSEDAGGAVAAANNGRRRISKRASSKKSFAVVKTLDFSPAGKPSITDFVAEKQPQNMHEKNLVAVYYLKEVLGISDVTIGHVLSVYRTCSWTAPSHPDASLRKTASEKHWLDTSDASNLTVPWAGHNYIESSMPTPKKSK